MKPGTAPLKCARLMYQMLERIRYLHFSLSTEKLYLYWVRFSFVGMGATGNCSNVGF